MEFFSIVDLAAKGLHFSRLKYNKRLSIQLWYFQFIESSKLSNQKRWSFPGGHLEMGETVLETAKRETMEETSLDIDSFELISLANERRYLKSAVFKK